MDDGPRQNPTERVIRRARLDDSGVGKPLSRRTLQRQRSVESYLLGEVVPRYMERAAEIEDLTALHAQALRGLYRGLCETHRRDPAALTRAWAQTTSTWDFRKVNVLIRQHNDWYPIERDLPMDPRTGDYVLLQGRSYRREELGPQWADAAGRDVLPPGR